MALEVTEADRFRKMLTIRRFEEEVIRLHAAGAFGGHYHVYIGQEATAVVTCESLAADDLVFSTWRNHGHLLARGADAGRMLAEILGRRTGYNRGKSGSMHLAAAEVGIPTTSGVVGGNLPIATGAALALKRRGGAGIAVAFCGDVALEEGVFIETLNLAALWRVPVLFVCENNSIPQEKRKPGQFSSSTLVAERLCDLPAALGVVTDSVPGDEVRNLALTLHAAVAAVRSEGAPRFVEVTWQRWPGNYGQWPALVGHCTDLRQVWSPGDGTAVGRDRWADPLIAYGRTLLSAGTFSAERLQAIDAEVAAWIEAAARFALESPVPDAREAYADVWGAPGAPALGTSPAAKDGPGATRPCG